MKNGLSEKKTRRNTDRIWSIDTESRVQVFNARLYAIQQGWTEWGLLVLQFIENFTCQVLLQQWFGIRCSELGVASFQFFQNSSVNHGFGFITKNVCRKNGTRVEKSRLDCGLELFDFKYERLTFSFRLHRFSRIILNHTNGRRTNSAGLDMFIFIEEWISLEI